VGPSTNYSCFTLTTTEPLSLSLPAVWRPKNTAFMPIVIIPSPYMSTARDAVRMIDSTLLQALIEMSFSTCTA